MPPQARAGDGDRVHVGPVGRVALERLPALDRPLAQLRATADDVEAVALGALPDGQRQSPVALLGDHPVAHRAQPVELAFVAEAGDPPDVIDHVHDLVAQAAVHLLPGEIAARDVVRRAHGDVPLVHDPVQQWRVAAPAMRVPVRVRLQVIEHALPLEVLDHPRRHRLGIQAGEPAEALDVATRLVERADDRQTERLAQVVVLGAAAGRDMDDAGALVLADVLPGDHAMPVLGTLQVARERGRDRIELIERPGVVPADEIGAGAFLEHLERTPQRRPEGVLAQPVAIFPLAHLDVRQLGAHGRGHVRAQRPRGGRPHQQVLTGAVHEREPDGEARVLPILVALVHLHLADARAAAGAPGHGVEALVQPATLVALGQEPPDEIVVLVREREVGSAQVGHAQAPDEHLHGVGHGAVGARDGDDLQRIRREQVAQPPQLVGVVPVHPHAQADRLLGLLRGVGQHPLLAQAHERVDAIALDVPLAGVAQLPLHVDLDPETLAVEAVLPALVVAEHRMEPLVEVLVGPPPRVVDGHRVVGGDGPVEERPLLVARVLCPEAQERRTLPPQVQDAVLLGREVRLGGKRTESRPGSGPRLGSRHEATRIDEREPRTGCPR